MSTIGLWDNKPAPAIERLARIEGQSNFLSLLSGTEAGPDTTQDMGALAFARTKGCIPEVLEAHVAKSLLFKLPLMSLVFKAICEVLKPGPRETPWMQGAVADAFFLLRDNRCKPIKERAKQFEVNESAYAAARSLAYGVFNDLLNQAIRKWNQSLAREIPEFRQSESGDGRKKLSPGCYRTPALPSSDDQWGSEAAFQGKAVGVNDRLGWDERNDTPSQCLTLAVTASDPPMTGMDTP